MLKSGPPLSMPRWRGAGARASSARASWTLGRPMTLLTVLDVIRFVAGLALCQRWAGLGHGLADFLGTAAPAGQLLRGDKVALAEVITEALDQPGHLAAVLVQRRAPVAAAKLPLGQFEAGQPAGLLLLPLGLLDLLASLLHQRRASGGGLALGFTQQHPRLITGAGGVFVLAVGEARQAAIVAAVGAGRVGVVLAGQRRAICHLPRSSPPPAASATLTHA